MRARGITPGPVGKGTQFRVAVAAMGRTAEMLIECTGYDRPTLLASTTTIPQADFRYLLMFEPVAEGTRMRWSRSSQRSCSAGRGAPHPLERPATAMLTGSWRMTS